MLSDKVTEGCRRILGLLSTADVISIAATSTNRSIAVESRNEAEKVILAFTTTAFDFLKRKKISRETLIKYLYNERVPVQADASKREICDMVMKHWEIKQGCEPRLLPESGEVALAAGPSQGISLHQTDYQPSTVSVQNNYTLNQTVNYNLNCSVHVAAETTPLVNIDQQHGEAFVRWYYDMLNSHNPILEKVPEKFGPHHFWDNVHLALSFVSSTSEHNEIVNGSISVAERLLSFPKTDHLIFNPNVNSDGVTVKSHPYGAKVILVCGLLHKLNACVGMFRQSFALVNDPLAPENWKVKVTCLQMKEETSPGPLNLMGSTEVQAIEQHTATALQQLS